MRLDPSHHFVLVRTPHAEAEADPYHSTLGCPSRTYDLPVLGTLFTDTATLGATIERGPRERYAGVILTSGRAVEAWALASTASTASTSPRASASASASWCSIPFFVVGPATASALAQCLPSPPPPVLGSETGTAALLAETITAHFPSPPPLPLLYLTGDKNPDTLPSALERAGLATHQVQVYQTAVVDDFEQALDQVLVSVRERHEGHHQRPTVWFAFFSPSGARHCLEALRRRELLPGRGEQQREECDGRDEGKLRIRLAGIGPTTRTYVERDEGLTMHAVAQSPDPVELVRAMSNAPL